MKSRAVLCGIEVLNVVKSVTFSCLGYEILSTLRCRRSSLNGRFRRPIYFFGGSGRGHTGRGAARGQRSLVIREAGRTACFPAVHKWRFRGTSAVSLKLIKILMPKCTDPIRNSSCY